MSPTIIRPANREEWLALRKHITGASEIAALVGAHPFLSIGQLWALKAGRVEPDPENAAMKRGRYLEETALRLLVDERPFG